VKSIFSNTQHFAVY